MARKQIIKIGIEAREELAKGAKFLAEAVSRTVGPFGDNWFLEKGNKITNDGVSVAREIQISSETTIEGKPGNELNNRGAWALREAAIKTNDEVGDGTTTSIILAWAIYQAVSRFLAKDGVVAQKTSSEIVKEIERERQEVTLRLAGMATPIETEEQLINSAVVSVEDKELGALIGKAQWELGKEGFLLAEETAERMSSVEHIKGIRIDNGFGTSQVINNQEKQTLEVEDTRVLLTTHTIKTIADWQHIIKLYDKLIKNGGKNLVIIARAWTDEAINWCLQNINKGASIYPLSAPYVDMQERMKDIQAIVGGTFYDSENSTMEDFDFIGLGYAKRVVARRFDAVITGAIDTLTQASVDKRVEELNQKHDGSESEFEKKTIKERVAQLQSGFAVVKVGSPSDMERKRLYDKCEDAVNAVRAAFQEGTVPGGGLAFKTISDELPEDYILKRPLLAIYEQIMSSAPKGFVIEDWVRDPVKVLRVALERACAAASSFATAGGAIAQAEDKPLDSLIRARNPQE